MTRSSAESNGAARVAVVGAPSVDGTHVREALADRGVAGERVDLYGSTRGEVVLSEYAGEARMIQEPEVEDVARHDLVFLCEPGEFAGRLAAAAPAAVIIDLGDCLPQEVRPRRVHLDVRSDVSSGACRFAVPHPLAFVLAEALEPLERRFGLVETIAVVIRPAADFGREGVEELREQTVRLLNFSRVPVDTFGRQLAFNLIPGSQVPAAQRNLDDRLAREVNELLGWTERRFTAKPIAAPLFHGHGFQLRFRLAEPAGVEQVLATLDEHGLLAAQEATTPLDVTGDVRTILSDLSEDGLGGFWLWGVAGESGARGARQAVRLAAALFDL